jgi:uncharacterized membrane protein HdeD (DUF308 family)
MNQENEFIKSHIHEDALKQLKENWNWFFVLGIALVVLGSVSILFAVATTMVTVVFLGAVLLTAGIFEAIKSFKINKWSTFFLHLFLSVLYVVAGGFIILNPVINALSLTILVAMLFLVSGIVKIIFSFAKNLPHRFWLLLSGILSVILGILIIKEWPTTGLWVIGMLLGVDLVFAGWTWIMLSLSAKNMKIESRPL